jgi:hypothetical protein
MWPWYYPYGYAAYYNWYRPFYYGYYGYYGLGPAGFWP